MVEDRVRREWMPERYGQRFSRERVELNAGGVFDFDAVSADATIVASISTIGLRTAGGSPGSGKVQKVRSDIFFLLLAKAGAPQAGTPDRARHVREMVVRGREWSGFSLVT